MSVGLEKELKIDDVDAKPHTHVYINVWNLQGALGYVRQDRANEFWPQVGHDY